MWTRADLAQANEHVKRARKVVQRQEEIITDLRRDRHDTASPEDFLGVMVQTLKTFERHRDLIESAL